MGFYSKNGHLVLSKTKNMFDNSNFNLFSSQICEALKGAFETFFEQDVKITLQAINDFREIRNEKLISCVDFFIIHGLVAGYGRC